MTAEQFLNFWRLKAEDFKAAELSKLDGLMFEVVFDARQKGLSRAEVDEAAGGYFTRVASGLYSAFSP